MNSLFPWKIKCYTSFTHLFVKSPWDFKTRLALQIERNWPKLGWKRSYWQTNSCFGKFRFILIFCQTNSSRHLPVDKTNSLATGIWAEVLSYWIRSHAEYQRLSSERRVNIDGGFVQIFAQIETKAIQLFAFLWRLPEAWSRWVLRRMWLFLFSWGKIDTFPELWLTYRKVTKRLHFVADLAFQKFFS